MKAVIGEGDGSTAQVQFEDPASTLYHKGPNQVGCVVDNLVITGAVTNAGNSDYFKFDPVSTNSSLLHPSITFIIEDRGDPHRYRWTVQVKDTHLPTYIDVATVKGTGFGTGPVTVTLNDPSVLANNPETLPSTGAVRGQDKALVDWGTYSFEIFARFVGYRSRRFLYSVSSAGT